MSDFDSTTHGANGRMNSMNSMNSMKNITSLTSATRERALHTVTNALEAVESERAEFAHAYASAPGHSVIEHALGESLTFLRKAIEKLIKARNELMQQPLPME